MIAWLTPDHGKIVTSARGALRNKSFLLGHLDLFYTCELLYYAREGQDVPLLRECSPLDARTALRSDWRATALASYFTDLITRMLPERAIHPEIYELLTKLLNLFVQGNITHSLLFWAELKLLQEMGQAPRLSHCTSCHRIVSPSEGGPFQFCRKSGGVVCPDCTVPYTAYPLSPDILALLLHLQRMRQPANLSRLNIGKKQLKEAGSVLGGFMHYQLDDLARHRKTVLEILELGLYLDRDR